MDPILSLVMDVGKLRVKDGPGGLGLGRVWRYAPILANVRHHMAWRYRNHLLLTMLDLRITTCGGAMDD